MNIEEKGDLIIRKWSKHEDIDDALMNMETKIEQLQAENNAMRKLLKSKIAIAKAQTDNENYLIMCSIKEAEEAMKAASAAVTRTSDAEEEEIWK